MERKQICNIIAIIVCCLTLAACGKPDTPDADAWETLPEESDEAEEPPLKNADGEDQDRTQEPPTEKDEKENPSNKSTPEETPNEIPAGNINEVNGNIESLGEGSFMIAQAFTEDAGDGFDVMAQPVDVPEESLVTVFYTENTDFIVRISDGMTGEDTAGSKNDLEKDRSVILEGSWDNTGFHATKVIIYHFNF